MKVLRQVEFGSPDELWFKLDSPDLVVLVGPNNAGKSHTLRALYDARGGLGRQASGSYGPTIRSTLWATHNELVEHFAPNGFPVDVVGAKGALSVNSPQSIGQIHSVLVATLDGNTRLDRSILQAQVTSYDTPPKHVLHELMVDDEKRAWFERHVFRGLRLWPHLDPVSHLGQLSLRLGSQTPCSPRGLRVEDSQQLRGKGSPPHQSSDGVRAYLGILLSLRSSCSLLLVDEPEAFLHPPLARQLGRAVGEAVLAGKQVVCATHSVDFLQGCLESSADTTIVRLNYDAEERRGSGTVISNDVLAEHMKRPLLRFAASLKGLFARGAVVVEGPSDLGFYQEINHRLLAIQDPDGCHDTVFFPAGGKQQARHIVGPLTEMGCPSCAIVDMDFLANDGGELAPLLEALGVAEETAKGIRTHRDRVWDNLKVSDGTWRTRGVAAVPAEHQKGLVDLLRTLELSGIFVVPVGAVEGWLRHYDLRKSSFWLVKMFEKMGADPAAPDYLHPGGDDVWLFMRRIGRWLRERSG